MAMAEVMVRNAADRLAIVYLRNQSCKPKCEKHNSTQILDNLIFMYHRVCHMELEDSLDYISKFVDQLLDEVDPDSQN